MLKYNPLLKWLLLPLLLCVVLIAGILNLLTGLLAHMASEVPPSARPAVSPSMLGLAYEPVHLQTEDNVHIEGWWFPKGSDNGKPVVLVLHGFGAAKEHMINYILLAQQHGYPAMVIDFRGHGGSDPSLASFGYHERKDVFTALKFLADHNQKQVCLWGTSMGAVTALLTASEHPTQLCGVIADAPFDTLHNTIVDHARLFYGLPEFPLLTLAFLRIERMGHYKIRYVDTTLAIPKIHVPVFFLAAAGDKRMPVALVKSLFDSANEPKKWYVIPGTGHEFRPFEAEYQKQICDFLNSLK